MSANVHPDTSPARSRFTADLLRIGLPIALQNLVSAAVNMVSTILVGSLGTASLAAVGLGNQVFFLLNLFLFGISTGGGVFVAQYWGKRDLGGLRRTAGLTLGVGLGAALLFTAVASAAPAFLIGIYSRDPEVVALGARFLKVACLSYLPFSVSAVLGQLMRSTEKVRLPLVATTLSLALSVFLSWVLIFGKFGAPALGIVGAAWAAAAARLVEVTILLSTALLRRYPFVGRLREALDWPQAWVARFVRIALPVVLNEITWSLGITLYSLIFARAGTGAIAAYNVTSTVSQLAMVAFLGTGNAAAVMIGKKIGEGEEALARAWARRFALLAPLFGLAMGALLVPFRLLLPHLFSLEPSVLLEASRMVLVLAALYPFKVFNFHLIVGICRAGGDTTFGMLYDLFGVWVLALPLAALGAFVWHLPAWAIFLLTASDDLGKCLPGLWRLGSGRWLHDVTSA